MSEQRPRDGSYQSDERREHDGILHVTMCEDDALALYEFDDWYNNEHGPARMRLSFVPSGDRYRRLRSSAIHDAGVNDPSWLAVYNVTDIRLFEDEVYLRLRAPPFQSEREMEIKKHLAINRQILALVNDLSSSIVETRNAATQSRDLVEIVLLFKKQEDPHDHLLAIKDHVGRLRDRLHLTKGQQCAMTGQSLTILVQSHDSITISEQNLWEIWDAMCTQSLKAGLEHSKIRTWRHYYALGPAPRHLTEQGQRWQHRETMTIPASLSSDGRAAIESYVTTRDGENLPFRLEGSTDPQAPLILLVNSVMVNWNIWDSMIAAFYREQHNAKYRILRYLPRGRMRLVNDQPITIETLAGDIVNLLDALRVQHAACVMGVSLGGATTLYTALHHADRVDSALICDTNASSPPGNAQLWTSRIEMAEKEGAIRAADSESIIGEDLAEATVQRWFTPEFRSDEQTRATFTAIREGVQDNSLPGFKQQVQALFSYDMTSDLSVGPTRAAFLVGEQDGKLPEGMKTMADAYGSGAPLTVIKGAGHLPMVEQPQQVADALSSLLRSIQIS